MEKSNTEMFELYGISEWDSKRELLSESERIILIRDLENGINTPLIESLRLPFPQFVTIYFSKYKTATEYLEDPAFGYKLYLMPSSAYSLLRMLICEGKKEKHTTRNSAIYAQFKEFNSIPLDKIPKIMSAKRYYTEIVKKFVYLTKYIDFNEAEKLGLNTIPFQDLQEDGYELDKKLELFNPVIRKIIELYYGLKNGDRKTPKEISEALNIAQSSIESLLKEINPLMSKQFAILKNRIEPIGQVDGTIIYSNKPFKKFDLGITTEYYYTNILSDIERQVVTLGNRSRINDATIYIGKKYLFPSMSTRELADYLVVDLYKIDSIETSAKKM